MQRFFQLAPLLVVAFLTACPSDVGPGGGAPQIISFTANPTSISAPGQAVTLSWEISGSVTTLEIDQGVGQVVGSDIVVNPTAATTYTLTASNSSGSDTQSTTVTFGTGGGDLVEDGLPPTLTTFGVSLTQTDFQNDQAGNIEDESDSRIVRVQPGGTFYAVVSASDPGGIASVTPFLANSSPPGLRADLVLGQSVGGFTLTGEVGGCILDGTQTAVTCIYEIAVGNIPNIDELEGAGSEFAYVFRTRVTDNAGLVADVPPRGYVIVGDGGGTPPPSNPTPPPGEPTPPPPGNPTPPPPGNPTPPPPGNPTTFVLTLNKAGTGEGSVTSAPSGINCDDDCGSDTGTYNSGTSVELTAEAAQGSTFAGWNGSGCSGTNTCQVTMSQARTVTATFNTASTTPQFSVSVANVSELTLNSEGEATAELDGTVSNAPAGTTYKWTVEEGDASKVQFATDTSVDTGVTFSEASTYKLRLTATSGSQTPFADATVVVKPAPVANSQPTVEITEPTEGQTLTLVNGEATLDLTAQGDDDDAADEPNLVLSWSATPSGPTFSSATGESTTATFTTAGEYTVTVTVDDKRELTNSTNTDDVIVNVE